MWRKKTIFKLQYGFHIAYIFILYVYKYIYIYILYKHMKNIKTILTRDIIPYFLWVPRHQAASAMMGATFAAAASPLPALAARVEEEDEGFDLRILAVPWIPSRMEGFEP